MNSEMPEQVIPIENAIDPASWVDRYADELYRFAIARLRDEEIARDLVQDVFLAALQQCSNFKGQSSEKTWIFAILKHKIVDFYRKKNALGLRETKLSEEGQESFFEVENGHWRSPHLPQEFNLDENNPLLIKELGIMLNLCLKKLPPLWFSIFSMKHMEDLDSAKICLDLKVSEANFWVIMHRTKINLRACLQKYVN